MKKSISGIRGIFGKDLTLNDVLNFSNNFSTLINDRKCVIGIDTRNSSDMIKETVSAALMQHGINVYNLGIVPTPVVFRESRNYGAGIVVTSSHNPLEWNGLKFIIDGRGINEKELEIVINDQENLPNRFGTEKNIVSNYVNDAVKQIGKSQEVSNVTIDIGGGAAKNVAPVLLKEIGCNVKVINEELEKSSRGPDPTSDNLTELIANTEKNDFGFAFDLDADRLVIVIEGEKQSSDVTLGLGIAKTLEMGYKKFVISIDSSISIEKYIKDHGGQVQRSKVGEANVIDLMLKTNAQAGGEGSSAGFILPEFNFCRDGILTSGLIVTMKKNTIQDMVSFMKNYHQTRDKIQIDSKLHDETLSLVEEKIKKQYSEIITIDGIKAIIDEDSWVLVRKSNTEDIIRISSESNDKNKLESILQKTMNLVNECHEQVK